MNMNIPDPVANSYTESISSELYRRMEAEENNSIPNNKISVQSGLNNLNGGGSTAPLNINQSMFSLSEDGNGRRGSATKGSIKSSVYPHASEENSLCSYGGEGSDDGSIYKVTPLPRVQMFVISVLLFSEPLTSTILFPFIYSMVSKKKFFFLIEC